MSVDPGEVPVLVAAAAERWAIIQDLANSNPSMLNGYDVFHCRLCGRLKAGDDILHSDDCLWVRAREAAQHRQGYT